MLAPMILQEVQAGGGGGEEEMAPQEAQPVFRKGGKFVGTIGVPFLSEGRVSYYHTNQHNNMAIQKISPAGGGANAALPSNPCACSGLQSLL
jgi:hypothetical protein